MQEPAYESTPRRRTFGGPRPVAAAPAAGTASVTRTYGAGSTIARVLLTCLGAAGMIVGAFMTWLTGINGTSLTWNAFWSTNFDVARFLTTVGAIFILLGLLALVGLAFRTGWLTRLAGALGIVGFVLFAIQVFRASGDQNIQGGAWLALIGSVLALIGGFLGSRREVVRTPGYETSYTE